MLFDNNYELLHDRIDIKAVSPISEKEYQVGGSTALLDAIGRTIHKIGNVQKNTANDYRAEKVMFFIITDGEENSSHEYSADKIKAQIESYKKKYGLSFLIDRVLPIKVIAFYIANVMLLPFGPSSSYLAVIVMLSAFLNHLKLK